MSTDEAIQTVESRKWKVRHCELRSRKQSRKNSNKKLNCFADARNDDTTFDFTDFFAMTDKKELAIKK